MGTQHTIRHDNGKPLSCKTKQSTALSTLHTTKHMNWRDSSVTGRKPFLRLCADDSKVVCAGNSGWRELSGPARFGGGNDRKPKWKEEWSLSLPTVVVNNSYLEEVPACSLFRLCQPSVEWYSAQDSGAPTKGRGGGLTRGYVCNKRLLLSSGPGSLVNASMVRILRKGKKKNQSKMKESVSQLPSPSVHRYCLREVHDKGLDKSQDKQVLSWTWSAWNWAMCTTQVWVLTITSCLATVREHRSIRYDADRTRCPWTLPGDTFGLCMMGLNLKKKITHRGVVMAQLVKSLLWVLVRVSIVVIKHHDKRQI